MRRKFLILPLLILALGAVTALGFGAVGAATNAQTPAIKQETLGKTGSAVAPGKDLLLNRRTFAPGADSGAHPAAGPVVLYVQSGSVVFTVVKGAAQVTPAGEEYPTTLNAGGSATLKTGDVVAYDAGVVHDVHNTGTVDAITYESRLNPATTKPAS